MKNYNFKSSSSLMLINNQRGIITMHIYDDYASISDDILSYTYIFSYNGLLSGKYTQYLDNGCKYIEGKFQMISSFEN